MKFGQLIEYKERNIFLECHAENETGRLIRDPFLFFKKAFYEVKATGLPLVSIYFDSSRLGHTIKTNYVKL